MLGFIPIGGELVRAPDDHRFAFDRESFGRFQPGLECLLRELLAGAVQESGPCFSGRERHSALWKTLSGGGEARRAEAKTQFNECGVGACGTAKVNRTRVLLPSRACHSSPLRQLPPCSTCAYLSKLSSHDL